MLAIIRKLVYRMGFRPKYRTILYSPTLDYLSSSKHLSEIMRDGFEQALALAQEVTKRLPQDCAKCNGWILNDSGNWVRSRETEGMICPACGTDYGSE